MRFRNTSQARMLVQEPNSFQRLTAGGRRVFETAALSTSTALGFQPKPIMRDVSSSWTARTLHNSPFAVAYTMHVSIDANRIEDLEDITQE